MTAVLVSAAVLCMVAGGYYFWLLTEPRAECEPGYCERWLTDRQAFIVALVLGLVFSLIAVVLGLIATLRLRAVRA